jgi:predicted transposase/invertase (TIGR01784 family)
MDKSMFLPVKSDIIFRLFFADERNEEFLVSLLKSILRLPEDDYNEIEIADPHLLREFEGDKLAIIDVKLYTRTRKIIHIEIQLKVTAELKNRIILYNSRLITEQIGSGQEYGVIHKAISIIITDEDIIPVSPRYHHRFTFYDPQAEVEFSDTMEIHSIELKKLPEDYDGTALYDWARFIAAESEEEMKKAAERNQEVRKAMIKYQELTADEEARNLLERREKARRDRSMFERWAIKKATFEIARKLLAIDLPIEKIIETTGLSLEEIENLKNGP